MNRFFFILGCIQIVYLKDGLRKSQPMNVLQKQNTPFINRKTLENLQQLAQVRFLNETDKKREFQIKDAYIENILLLGHMTNAEFHEGYPEASIVNPEDLVNKDGNAELVPDQEEQAALGDKDASE